MAILNDIIGRTIKMSILLRKNSQLASFCLIQQHQLNRINPASRHLGKPSSWEQKGSVFAPSPLTWLPPLLSMGNTIQQPHYQLWKASSRRGPLESPSHIKSAIQCSRYRCLTFFSRIENVPVFYHAITLTMDQ